MADGIDMAVIMPPAKKKAPASGPPKLRGLGAEGGGPEDIDEEGAGDDVRGEMLAEGLAEAVQAGDGKAILRAFKRLGEYCRTEPDEGAEGGLSLDEELMPPSRPGRPSGGGY